GNAVTFSGLPDIPISRFQLTFTNPPGLLETSRDICVPPAPSFHADFTGYNGKSASVDSPATVDGCGASHTAGKCRKRRAKKHIHHAALDTRQRTRSGEAAVSKSHRKRSCKKGWKR